jgi:type IV secretion system protein VirB9
VIIKPTDIGLVTNLVITTDRRAYTIKLVSRREDWMPRVSFFYPDAVQQQWSAYRTQQERLREAADPEPREAGPADLDFAYEISGDSPSWRPVRMGWSEIRHIRYQADRNNQRRACPRANRRRSSQLRSRTVH